MGGFGYMRAVNGPGGSSTRPVSDPYREYILAELRVLAARLRADTVEVDTIGVALGGGFLTSEEAVHWLREIGYSNALGIDRHGGNDALQLAETARPILRGQGEPRGTQANRNKSIDGQQDDQRGRGRQASAARPA
jgi:hypothetical protein